MCRRAPAGCSPGAKRMRPTPSGDAQMSGELPLSLVFCALAGGGKKDAGGMRPLPPSDGALPSKLEPRGRSAGERP
eukprot:253069-Prymnesium_polylepis.1